jgi:hypothetical protein
MDSVVRPRAGPANQTLPSVASRQTDLRTAAGGATQSNARIDHPPDCAPARHCPVTAPRVAISKRRPNGASGGRSRPALHEPEYSAVLPERAARQAPVHPADDFAADHVPRAAILRFASVSVHVPVTAPVLASIAAVHVPCSVRPDALRALQVFGPRPSRADASCCGAAPVASSAAATTLSKRSGSHIS